jgi:signal transduction histidine kinase
MKIVLLALLCAFFPAHANDVQVLQRADMLASLQDTVPGADEPWQPLMLPHNWYRDRSLTSPVIWYRLHVTAQASERNHALFMPRIWVQDIVAYVNGRRVWQPTGYLVGAPMNAVLMVIPADTVDAGKNTIHLRVTASPELLHGVPRIHFGEAAALREHRATSKLLRSHLPGAIAWGAGVLGALTLVLWLSIRREAVLLWYAATGLAVLVPYLLWHSAQYAGDSVFWQTALDAFRFHAYLMPLLIFHLRLAGERRHANEAWMWLIFVAAIASIAFRHPAHSIALAMVVSLFACVPALYVLVLLRRPQLRRNPAIIALAAADIVLLLSGLHDRAIQFGFIPYDRPQLTTYAPALVMLAGSVPMLQHVLMSVWAQRARRRQAEREKLVAEERRRIMADMHDGLGARLVALLSMAQSGTAEARELGEGIAAALEELRLTVDAVEPVEGDVSVVLGNVRHRMRSVLERTGMRFLWHVPDLPPIEGLTPRRILAIQRLLLEVFANAMKHSGAKTITVSASALPDGVQIAIEDDGRGFDAGSHNGGRGLGNLRLRAAQAGGALAIDSAVGAGTKVTIVLPIQDVTIGGQRSAAYPDLGMSPQRSPA